jgi:transposase
MKAIPGRKTDVNDAEWIAQLLQHGLLRASFIPDREQRELRELTHYRKSRIEERARELNRLQKMLEGANIKLGDQLSDITGMSAQALLDAMLSAETLDLQTVAKHRHGRVKASAEDLLQSLDGIITPLQRELLREVLRVIREQDEQIKRIDALLERHIGEKYRAAAEALEQIPGVGRVSAQQIIAEIGVDMSRFPSAQHLYSWAGVCPGNNESAGKRKSGKTKKANKALKTTLATCAKAAVKNKNTFFYAQYQRIVVRRGKNKATMAVAHSMLIAIYHVLQGNDFRDLGSEYYNQFNREKKINSHFKALEKLGFTVTDEMRAAA